MSLCGHEHVVLDGGPAIVAEIAKRFAQSREVHDAVHRLEVQVGDATVVFAVGADRVSPSVGVVADVVTDAY